MGTIDILGLFAGDIADELSPFGIPKFRSRQIAEWIYKHQVFDFAEMTNLPLTMRQLLQKEFTIGTVTETTVQSSQDGRTSKYLLAYTDGCSVETVLMRQPYGNSVCVSSQVGCAMGCVFCASTLNGMSRNLSGGEMLLQVLHINTLLANSANSVSNTVNNIVIMGSGEPMANYDNVIRFIRLCHEEYCLNLSYRNITLSTAGIVPGIYKLATEKIPITLSVSLHAPDNNLRSKLMPINNKYPIETVMEASDHYASETGRRVTYEYILIAGINDSPEQAKHLARLLKKRLANVNLIPANPVPERGLLRPAADKIHVFEKILKDAHVNVTLRREMGADIQAACGQLRQKILGVTTPKSNQ